MFKTYLNRSDYVKFGYVYDDTDGTCEIVNIKDIRNLMNSGVDLNVTENFSCIDKNSVFYNKISLMYGFSHDYSVFNLFEYYVDNNHVLATLVLIHGLCYIDIKIKCSYFFGDGSELVTWNPLSQVLRFLIPVEMVYYVLRLYNERNFNGIMKAFNGYLGTNIYKFSELYSRVGEVKFDKWLTTQV